jgi:hypothetical protein
MVDDRRTSGHEWRDDDRDAHESGLLNPPFGSVSARLDDETLESFSILVRAAQTRDRAQISDALDHVLSMTRSRRVGVKYALRLGLWCVMTDLEGVEVGQQNVQPTADRIFESVSMVLTTPDAALTGVLEDATRPTSETYSLPEAEFLLVAAVALGELMRTAPAAGQDLPTLADFAVQHCQSTRPAEVEQEWLTRVRPGT